MSSGFRLALALRSGVSEWRHAFLCRSQLRCYSVRVPGNGVPAVSTVADLKSWHSSKDVEDVEVSGWVRSVRKSSGVRFVDITDGSSMRPLQAVVNKYLATEIRPGTAVRLRGIWHTTSDYKVAKEDIKTPESSASDLQTSASRLGVVQPDPLARDVEDSGKASEVDSPTTTVAELQVRHVDILGHSDPQTYPIQNKYQTPESLRYMSHLRPRTPLNSTLLRLRSDATAMLTQFFFREKFQQTHPPIITSSDCEGAGEAFAVKAGAGSEEFFKDAKFLTVSTQLHLEALAQALGNVWTLSPTFRAEQSDTSRHLSEFYMLEAEMSFVQDMNEVMDLVQKMLKYLVNGLKELDAFNELANNRLDAKESAERLAFQDLVDRTELQRRWRGLVQTNRWPRITYSKALEILDPVADQFEHKPVWGAGLQSEHERYLAEKVGFDPEADAYQPVFVTHYPRDIKAFYMSQSSSSPPGKITVDCFDLLAPSLGELAGGSMREHRLAELEENMRLHGLEVPPNRKRSSGDMGWYLDLRRWGCPPHGGFGLGFDRLLSYLTGVPNAMKRLVCNKPDGTIHELFDDEIKGVE